MGGLRATANNLLFASKIVKRGGLVVYPTDTVYGLGCDPFNVEAVRRILRIKNKRKKPLPILASDLRSAEKIARLSIKAKKIATELWPGPVTLVVQKRKILPDIVTYKLDTVGVRVPKHDIAVRLILLSGGLLVGTSANKTGEKPPLTALEVSKQLYKEADVILDGGPTTLGTPSTIIDLTSKTPKILREGPIGLEGVLNVLSAKSTQTNIKRV